jgi:Cu/Ag efflux protein CusF
MNKNLVSIVFSMALSAWITSCSTAPEGASTLTAAFQPGVPGGTQVRTFKTTATVTAIDPATRKLTLAGRDGSESTFKAGPDVVNFDQIHVGDQVKATVAEQLVVFMRQNGAPAGEGESAAIALAPAGAKPGVFLADTAETTAKVHAINLKRHQATLLFPNGKTRTFTVRADVDLNQVKLGDDIVIRATQALAIQVEKR